MPRKRPRKPDRRAPTDQLAAALPDFQAAVDDWRLRNTARQQFLARYRQRCAEAALEAQRHTIRQSVARGRPSRLAVRPLSRVVDLTQPRKPESRT